METFESFKVDYLGIEVTRRCNLECAHCLRGDRESKDIQDSILYNIFNGVTEIGTLFLTGGEPFLVPEKLEKILSIINKKGIKTHYFSITTNATVLSQRQIDIIHEIERISTLDIRFSHDKFHEIEQERKGLTQKFNENMKTFSVLGYTNENQSFIVDTHGIRNIGRAKYLTPNILKAVNEWKYPTNYEFDIMGSPNTFDIFHLIYQTPTDLRILGNILFDVSGNLVNNDMSYETEDKSPIFRISCADKTILEAALEYERKMGDDYDEYYREHHLKQYADIYSQPQSKDIK